MCRRETVFRRPRPTTLLALGTLAFAGLAAAGRARRDADSPPETVARPEPARPEPARSGRRSDAGAGRRGVAITCAGGAAVFLFAGAVWSGGQARAHELSPAAQARFEDARADAARLALLGRLQLAGIASRRIGVSRGGARTGRRALAGLPAPREGDRQIALARYVEAIGPESIGSAVEASASELAQRVLADDRVQLSSAGRADVASGRMDPRVLALIEYLAEAHGQVAVSCLITGHSHYVAGRKGVVSAHVYGRAADISSVGGVPVIGNQQPGGHVDRVIREILSLPDPLRPKQVISLLDLSGPSFRLPDHADHLHIGY